MEQTRTLSQAQIDANRRNAQKSTGPRTPAGKNASSRNRLTHGLCSNKHLLLDEHPEDFLCLLDDHHRRYHPVGDAEIMMVERIAHLQWRLVRSVSMEEGLFRGTLGNVSQLDYHKMIEIKNQRVNHEVRPKIVPPAPNPPLDGDRLARAFHLDACGKGTTDQFQRYEANLERSLHRCTRLLMNMQTIRKQNPPETDGDTEMTLENRPNEPEAAAETTAEPSATPSNTTNCETKPNNGGMARTFLSELLATAPQNEIFAANEPMDPAKLTPERQS